jgi:D-alanyl-D-alanine carboxypeptidase
VVQRSFDGQNGDYVLYAFRITNQSREAITFTPGLFFDFDVSPEFFSNTGYTELGGQLMVTTTSNDTGRHLGSVLLGAPSGGRSYFFTPSSASFLQESEVVAAIRGEISNPSVLTPDDVRGLQGGATVKLNKGKSTEFWAVIVAGDDRAQTVANARAAIAEATARQRAGNTFVNVSGGSAIRSLGSQARTASHESGRLCKRDCVPD